MKYKKGLIFICLIICLFSIASVCASDLNETVGASEDQSDVVSVEETTDEVVSNDVNNTVISNENDNVLSVEGQNDEVGATEENELSAITGTFTDLANDIANAGDELNLTTNYKFSSSDSSDSIQLNKPITINGNGFKIDGDNQRHVFYINANNVVLNNISFVNCLSNYQFFASAVYIRGNNDIITNCHFENCHVQLDTRESFTGTIRVGGNNNIVSNCTFVNCSSYSSTSDSCGGAICIVSNGTLFNCCFMNCYALTSNHYYDGWSKGGAIYCGSDGEDYKSYINVINCSFEDNFADIGGAIYSEADNIKLENCIFKNNNATLDGGAIYLKDYKRTLFEGGDLYDLNNYRDIYDICVADFENCVFEGNLAKNGAAIYECNNGTILMYCNFINNVAICDGGALYFTCDYDFLSDCIFIDNKATNNGAAAMWKGNDGTISSSIFVNNTATKDSGVYIDGGNNFVKDSILLSNNQYPVIFSDTQIVTANYNWWGNTIQNYNQKPTIPTRINVKNWLFMNFTVDTNSLKVGEIATVTCDLTHLTTSNGIISKYNAFDLPIINLTVIADNFNKTINMIGGLCEAQYVATHIPSGSLTIKYNSIEKTLYFTIEKGNLQLIVSESMILKGNLIVTAPNNASGIVHILINSKDYSSIMVNGQAAVPITDLPLGRYLATTSFESDSYNVDTFNLYITIKSSIDANNLTKAQDNPTKFHVAFYDFDGNVLKNTKVTFMLNGGLQTEITDNNGVASLDINLSPNTYDITSLNPVTDETKINKIIITDSGESSTDNNNTPIGNNSGENSNQTNNDPKPINDNQITIPSLSTGSGFVKLPTDARGTITLDIAGKKYNFPVVNGVANVKLPDLANGNYGYIITYSGDDKYSSFIKTGSVTVKKQTTTTKPAAKTTIALKSVKVKKSAKKLVIQAILKHGKKPLYKKKIIFKFNGKKYTAKTNKNGIAKITIKKKVLKKLKVDKKVKIQASYGKAIAKRTVKVKK